ncbi:MAG: hypothetical protein SGJ27_16000 [Candidatus Melainabacteria bacterium]|nr:hypothetical protein [Candidatus Melainabacteria bacterium]
MKPNRPIFRLATPVIALAGTLCLMLPAYAGHQEGWGGNGMRQMRLDNPGMSNRQIKQMVRTDASSTNWTGRAINNVIPQFVQNRPTPQLLPLSINNPLNKFNGQSAFTSDNGKTRAVARGMQLDLTSSERSIVLGEKLFANNETYTIKVGGEERTLSSGSQVSAAEYVALQQVLNGGSQALTIDQSGRGVGGQFNLDSISDGGKTIRAAELVIPERVTASGDFSRHSEGVRVSNDLVNYGSINAFSSSKQTDTARISARDINNHAGASISTSEERLNLSLRADRDINNSGSISSSGDLELSAGRSIANSGTISSQANVNLAGNLDTDLFVNNTGGTISALNGAINVRSSEYDGTGNTTVYGGDLLSRELNLFTGLGTSDVFVNQLSGVVNASGSAAHVSANTDNLTIGTQCLVGDPTYFNTGNIQLIGDIIVGEALAIIAGGDITRGGTNTVIRAQTVGGVGQDITIIAGANITAGINPSGSTLPPLVQATDVVTINGASATGGNVDLSGVALTLDTSAVGTDLNAGNLTIAAYADSSQNKGLITIAPNGIINTSGSGAAGANGSIYIVAGGVGDGAINIGSQILSNSGSNITGDINIYTAQPSFSSGSEMTFDTTGKVTTGNSIVASGQITAGKITLGSAITTGPTNIVVNAGTGILVSSSIFNKGVGNFDDGGRVTLIAENGGVSSMGVIDVRGGNGALGGFLTIRGNDDSAPMTVLGAFADAGTGGTISITNNGVGGVNLLGILSAVANPGNGGTIEVSSASFIDLSGTLIVDNQDGGGEGGRIILGAENIVVGTGTGTLSALGQNGLIAIITTNGGITTNGNNFTAKTGGLLGLDLFTNTISADSVAGDGGDIIIEASFVDNVVDSPLQPLMLSANGGGVGSGGSISFTNGSTLATVIGEVSKLPKGDVNFLDISAHAGLLDGNGGSVTVDVGGDLIVNPLALDVAVSPGGADHNGGSVVLSAGNAPSTKFGKLVLLGDLEVTGTGTGNGGSVALSSSYTKNFVVGSTKVPKNGIFGDIETGNGTISIESGGGIQILQDTLEATTVSLDANGKGKIYSAKDLRLTAPELSLTSDTGSISLNTFSDTLLLSSNSSITIDNISSAPGSAGLLKIGNVIANGGLTLNSSGRINYSKVTVGTGGDVLISNDSGGISSTSFASMDVANGSVTLNSKNIVDGGINFATGGSVRTTGTKAGEIIIAIGVIPKKGTNSVYDQFDPGLDFPVFTTGKAKVFFGDNPTSITNSGAGPVQIQAGGPNITFSNQSLTQTIGFIGQGEISTND